MNKEQQLNSDKKVLASLEAEYKRAQRVIYSIRALVTDLNFEELIPDSQERCLMVDELQAYDYIRTNLMNRIRFYRARVKREESIKDWTQYKKTDSTHIGVDVSDEGDHGARCQVCGDDIATHHCGQDTRRRDEAAAKLCDLLVKCRMAVYAPGEKCAKCGGDLLCGFGTKDGDETICFNCANQITNDELQQALDEYRAACTHHCGQDATCQVDDGNAVVDKPIITGESLEQLVGTTVRLFHKPGHKCEGCPYEVKSYGGKCEYKKVELVGGYYLCLAPLPNSIITE